MPNRTGVIAVFLALSAALLSAANPPASAPRAKFEPPDGLTYHGVCLFGYWADADFDKRLKAYQAAIPDKPVALYSMFAHCMENGHWNTWRWTKPTPDGNWGNGVGANIERGRGRVPVVAWTWMDWHQMKNSPRLQDVPAGKYDWYFDDWIKGLKEYKSPIFIYGETGKPIMIPEGGTGDEVTRWNPKYAGNAAWTKELFDVIDATPRIKAVCWYEWDETWSLARDPAQLAEFRRRIAGTRYAGKFVGGDGERGSEKR
jgi:hypothetical protein